MSLQSPITLLIATTHAIDPDYFFSNPRIPSISSFHYLIIALVHYSTDFQLFIIAMHSSFSISIHPAFVAVVYEEARAHFLTIIPIPSAQFTFISL